MTNSERRHSDLCFRNSLRGQNCVGCDCWCHLTEPNSEEGQEKQYREKCGFTWMRISAKWRQLLTAVDAPESQP